MRKVIFISIIVILSISPWVSGQNIKPETVEFITDDGVIIKGSYYQPALPQRRFYPAILLLPEFRQRRQYWHEAASFLAEKGYAVLAIDFRGQGESTQAGENTLNWAFFSDSYFKRFLLDVKASIDYLQDMLRVDQRRIAIIGAGLGANIALIYASHNNGIKGLVLLSAGLSYRGLKTEEAIEEYGMRPVLMVVGEDDSYSLYSAKKLYSLAKGLKELKIYPDGSRGAKMLSRKPEIMKLISQWLSELFD